MADNIILTIALISGPLIMIIVGILLLTLQAERGGMIGYRTSKSQKSDATWATANSYFGKLSIVTNAISLIATILICVFVLIKTQDDNVLTAAILFISGMQIILIVADIIATEMMLSKKFDQDGNPK